MPDADHSLPIDRMDRIVLHHTAILFTAQALVTAVFMLMPALGGSMVLQLTGDVAAIGLPIALSQLGQTVTAYPAGRLMDAYGRRLVLLGAAALSAIGSTAIAATFGAADLMLFLLAAVAFGYASGPLHQIGMVAAEIQPPERRASALGLVLTGSVVGVLFTPALVAWLTRGAHAEAEGIVATWIFGAGALAVAAGVLAWLRPDPLEIARRTGGAPEAVSPTAAMLLRHPATLAPIAVSACLWGTMTLAMVVTPVALRQHGHHLGAIVSAVSIHAIGMYAFGLPPRPARRLAGPSRDDGRRDGGLRGRRCRGHGRDRLLGRDSLPLRRGGGVVRRSGRGHRAARQRHLGPAAGSHLRHD